MADFQSTSPLIFADSFIFTCDFIPICSEMDRFDCIFACSVKVLDTNCYGILLACLGYWKSNWLAIV